jgi:hypothetical protein
LALTAAVGDAISARMPPHVPWQGGKALQITESQASTRLADERQTSAAQRNETGTTAQVVQLHQAAANLECSKCGATAEAACNCGAPYIPAGELAAKAVAANPGKSDRVIAAEIGVSQRTISRARKRVEPNGSTQKRVGKDGKSYKARKPTKPKAQPEDSDNNLKAHISEIEAAREATPPRRSPDLAKLMADAIAAAIAATNGCLPSALSNAVHAGDVSLSFSMTGLDRLIEWLTDFYKQQRKIKPAKQTGGLFDSNH